VAAAIASAQIKNARSGIGRINGSITIALYRCGIATEQR
jgi:predicted GNAT family acetyltransferase